MSLASGTRLGPYQVESPLGAGGMGEVYRGRDTRLDRPVAIKVLPSTLAESPELRERFEREARLLSSLNHPHICVVYDVGHQNGVSYLVMELLEGETLAARIARGPMHVQQATQIGLQIGSALDRAHRVGVVHRDVKPENIMLTKTGAKLLDFGLAKPAPVSSDVAGLTRTLPITGQGTILGTLQYMAPEQLEGQTADARSDIFSFGAVLYEMITGQRAFPGTTSATIISAILRDQPPPISELQPLVPPALDAMVRTCLEKDPDERWHSAHDLTSQLRWIQQSGSHVSGSVTGIPAGAVVRRKRREQAAWAFAALMALTAGALAAAYLLRAPQLPVEQVRFAVPEPPGMRFNPQNMVMPLPTLSPDGRHIVFTAMNDETSLLYVRSLDSVEARPLAGTERGWLPFWSPDSRYVAFWVDNELKKTAISSGGVEVIARLDGFEGGSWSKDDVIIASQPVGGIVRLSPSGGPLTPVTKLDEQRKDAFHRAPVFLPDGQHFLFFVQPGNEVFWGSLDGTPPKRLLTADARALYSPPGYLLFVRDDVLFAQRFDPDDGELSGDPVRLVSSVRATPVNGRAAYTVSDTGVLVYRSGTARSTVEVRWRDRQGKPEQTVLEAGDYSGLALAPNERHLAYHRHEDPTGGTVWVRDLQRGDTIKLTSDQSHNMDPTWSPDGTRIAFTSDRNKAFDFYEKAAAGTGRDEPLLVSPERKYYHSWSRDKKLLIYQVAHAGQADIWVWPQRPDARPEPYLRAQGDENHAQFSPDGKWVAYASVDNGPLEVYVQPYPPNGDRYSVSTGGGLQPLWRSDGREIYYLTVGGALRAVSVTPGQGTFEVGTPETLFTIDMIGLSTNARLYQPSKDGQRFLISERPSRSDARVDPLTVIINWAADLERAR